MGAHLQIAHLELGVGGPTSAHGCFWKRSLTGAQTCLCIYMVSTATFTLRWQNQVTATETNHMACKAPNVWYLSLHRKSFYFLHFSYSLWRNQMHDNETKTKWVGAQPLASAWLPPISRLPRNMSEIPIPLTGTQQRFGPARLKGRYGTMWVLLNSQGQMVKPHSSQCECSCQKPNVSKHHSNGFFKLSEFL